MTIYPAIDMLGGRCVRLQQGDPNKEIVFADDPVRMAQKWAEQGAEWLHIVDLDGAFSGQPRNAEAIRNIAQSVNRPTQLGGGFEVLNRLRRRSTLEFSGSSSEPPLLNNRRWSPSLRRGFRIGWRSALTRGTASSPRGAGAM